MSARRFLLFQLCPKIYRKKTYATTGVSDAIHYKRTTQQPHRFDKKINCFCFNRTGLVESTHQIDAYFRDLIA